MTRGTLAKNEFVVKNKHTGELEVIDMLTGEVVSSETPLPEKTYAFDYRVAMLVCQAIAEGATMLDIDADPDLPPLHVVQHWMRSQEMFAMEVKLARRQRADVYHDRVAEVAKNAGNLAYTSKEELANAKLAADQYRWLAEKGNPDSYGNKVTHEGSEEKPITMRVINTGIVRNKPDIIIDSKEVEDVEYNDEEAGRVVRKAIGTERAVDEETRRVGEGSKEYGSTGKSGGSEPEKDSSEG